MSCGSDPTAGLFRLDNGQWRGLTKKDGLATDDARVILSGRDGNLWVGGYGGLSRIRNGQVRSWTEQDGLPGNSSSGAVRRCRGASFGSERMMGSRPFRKRPVHEIFQFGKGSSAMVYSRYSRTPGATSG